MKKLFSFSMLAIAAMAAFSCTLENENPQVEEKTFEPKVITASTDDDVLTDTKTSLSDVSILWATTDKIKGWDGTSVHESTGTAVPDGYGYKKAEFTFNTVSVAADLFSLAYPAENVSDIDNDFVYASIPSVQTATASSFADKANLAVANGLTVDPIFKNVGGLLSIIINNDNVTSVTLSANEDLTGEAKISLDPSSFAVPTILSGQNFVTIDGTIANGSTYYAVVYPGTYTGLTIEVCNSLGKVARYTNPNSLTVERNGNLHIATLTIPDGKWADPTPYKWTLASGDLGSTGTPESSVSKGTPSLTWNASFTWGDESSATKFFSYSSTNGVQVGAGSSANKCATLVLSTSGYTEFIKRVRVNFTQAKNGGASVGVSVDGIDFECGGSTTANAVDNTPDNYDFTYTKMLKGEVVISFSNTADKAFYIKSIEINPDMRALQELSFAETSCTVELSAGTFASPALDGASTTVTYESDDDNIATVDPSSGVVTLVAIGTCHITATAAADETHQEGVASYELNVTAGPSSIADVVSASVNDPVYTSGVVAALSNKGFVITDGSNNILVYENAVPTVALGQSVTVTGTRAVYNGVAQISSPTVTPGATGQTITRTAVTTVTSANATGYTSSTYISLSGTLAVSSPYFNVSIDGSSTQGSLYQLSGTEVFTAGTLSTLDGLPVIVTGYVVGSTNNYLAIAVVDIEIDTTVAFLSTTPADGDTIEWDDDEYGVGNAETITVSQNGAATGYSVDYIASADWTVTDDGAGTITVYPNAANTSTTTDKTLDITITHNDAALTSTITLQQNKIGSVNYATTYTTSSNCSVTSNFDNYSVVIGGNTYTCAKANKAGTFTITIPSGTTTVHLFIAAWKNEGCTVTVDGGTMSDTSITADSGISGSATSYTLSGTVSDYYRTITPATNSTTTITITLPSNKRGIVWGVNEE